MPSLTLNPSGGDPTEMTEAEKEKLREETRKFLENERLEKERRQDMQYEKMQKRKVEKDIAKQKPKKDPMLEPGYDQGQIEKEREMVEEYMKKNKPTTKKQKVGPASESLIEQYTRPDNKMCMTRGHENDPATTQITHNGLLGEDVPPLTFCKWCSKLLKVIPVGELNVRSQLDLSALVSLANKLDKIGLYNEANIIDEVLSK